MLNRLWMVLVLLAGGHSTAWGQADYTAGTAAWVDSSANASMVLPHGAIFAGGDVRFEGEPIKNAPYSAESTTETVQTLADGNRIRRENRTKLYRDSQGRTRREDRLESIGPWATGEARVVIFINDPVAGVQYVLDPVERTGRKIETPELPEGLHLESGRSLTLTSDGDSSARAGNMHVRVEHRRSGDPKHAGGGVLHREVRIKRIATDVESVEAPVEESLGSRLIEGVSAEGTRYTTTLAADQVGADRDLEIVFERWHSAELGLDVMTKRSDPRRGETTYRLTNISRVEPVASMFEPPADYRIEEGRTMRIHKRIEKQIR